MTVEVPRIVCTQCPAVAKVHYWGYGGANHFALWVECHGVHIYDLRYVTSLNDATAFTLNGKPLLFDELRDCGVQSALKAIEKNLSRRAEDSAAIDVQVKYLQAHDLPASAFEAIAQLAEREMQFWGELANKLEKMVKQ